MSGRAMRMRRLIADGVRTSLCGLGLWAAIGCRHLPVERAVGTSSMKVLEPPAAGGAEPTVSATEEAGVRVQFREARLRGPAAQPAYPGRALAAKVGTVQVGVRVVVDAQGRVAEIQPSLRAVTLVPAGFADDFWAEIEAAVRQWSFAPARIEEIETVTAEGISYGRVKQSSNVETEFDLVFTFKP